MLLSNAPTAASGYVPVATPRMPMNVCFLTGFGLITPTPAFKMGTLGALPTASDFAIALPISPIVLSMTVVTFGPKPMPSALR